MTDDWVSESVIEGFPREGTIYFVQFISEPEVLHQESRDGRKYTQIKVRLQFFAMTENTGEYVYMGWGEKKVQPCVMQDFAAYRHILMESCFKVTGEEHKKHVDIEVIEAFDRQQASEGYAPKPAPVQQPLTREDHEEGRHAPDEGGTTPPNYPSTEPPKCPKCQQPCTEFGGKWVHCGVEVVPSGSV